MRSAIGPVCAWLILGAGLARAELPPLKEPAPKSASPESAAPAPAAAASPSSEARATVSAPASPEPVEPSSSAVRPEFTDTAILLKTPGATKQKLLPDDQEKLWDLRTSMLFLERTHFAIVPMRFSRQYSDAYTERVAPLLFDATAALHLPISNRLSELLAYDAPGRYYNAYPYVSLSFVPTVRMSKPSLDVLTPSYRVGINLQWFLQRSRVRRSVDNVIVHGLRLSATHYSNGQGGCSFAKTQPDEKSTSRSGPPSVCRAAYDSAQADQPGDWYRRNVDQRSGSFSINYATLAYHVRRVWLDRARPDSDGLRAETRSLTGGLLVNGVVGAISGEGQKDLYPLVNVRGESRFEQMFNSYGYPLRLSAEGFVEWYALDQRGRFNTNAYTPWRAGLELTATLPNIYDLGVFAGVSGGQDPYNIHFVQQATWLQLGLVVDLFPRPRYGSGRSKPKKDSVEARPQARERVEGEPADAPPT